MVHLVPNQAWGPRTLQNQQFRKVFVPCWCIWCQTCAGGDFSASQHGVPEPFKLIFRGAFISFWSIWCQTAWVVIFRHPGTVSHQPFKNYLFVGRSSHVGTFGAKLALVVMFRHPNTLSQNHSKTIFSKGVRPIFQQNCIRK